MYESGVSKTARVLVVILTILLGFIFIKASGCSNANATAEMIRHEVVVETAAGEQHHFF
ncbi:MAG: hypothetical protein J6P93_05950 [Alphaproteobacteria bacterium]|nr:hypothetical protein [Alphaproteobacteria bacterium]